MREILFRGKVRLRQDDEPLWLYGDLERVAHKRFIDGACHLRVIPETVGQYIGIKDRNGTKVFEGDIIQTYFSFAPGEAGYGDSQKPFVVEWEQGRSAFRAKKPNTIESDWHLLDTIDFFEMQSHLYEVIGNIYDNPELCSAGR